MADEQGYIDTDKMAEFKPAMELQWHLGKYPDVNNKGYWIYDEKILQQKWTNELGESEWRDIPLVISDK